jgi:hypothetical protein
VISLWKAGQKSRGVFYAVIIHYAPYFCLWHGHLCCSSLRIIVQSDVILLHFLSYREVEITVSRVELELASQRKPGDICLHLYSTKALIERHPFQTLVYQILLCT